MSRRETGDEIAQREREIEERQKVLDAERKELERLKKEQSEREKAVPDRLKKDYQDLYTECGRQNDKYVATLVMIHQHWQKFDKEQLTRVTKALKNVRDRQSAHQDSLATIVKEYVAGFKATPPLSEEARQARRQAHGATQAHDARQAYEARQAHDSQARGASQAHGQGLGMDVEDDDLIIE